MEPTLFANVLQSLKEARAIARGELSASRRIVWTTTPDGKPVLVADERNVLLKTAPRPD
jgi:hypothetical protein